MIKKVEAMAVMERSIAMFALCLLASGAHAQTRPSTVNSSCSANRNLVTVRGAIVLGTGGYTYDRFVRDNSFCEVNEFAQPAYVPSLDNPQCFVGYRCKNYNWAW